MSKVTFSLKTDKEFKGRLFYSRGCSHGEHVVVLKDIGDLNEVKEFN